MSDYAIQDRIWGYEGCGSMWNFFSDQETAYSKAGDNIVHEVTVMQAHALDNKRRKELGFNEITLEEFKECIDHSVHCDI